jgi:sulfur carrier protein ThiS
MRIKLYGRLRQYVGGRGSIEVNLDTQKTVTDVIRALHIPENEVYVVERAGRAIDRDSPVNNADEITLLPLMEGG